MDQQAGMASYNAGAKQFNIMLYRYIFIIRGLFISEQALAEIIRLGAHIKCFLLNLFLAHKHNEEE